MVAQPNRPYIIFRPGKGAGFWSNFAGVLQGLDHADRHGLLPVIDMERYPTHYNDDSLPVKNAWEYYFEQPAGLSLQDALDRNPLDNHGNIDGEFTRIMTLVPLPHLLARGRQLVRQYIRVKPEIRAEAASYLPEGNHPDALGVHVRGTDMRRGGHSGHAVPGTPRTYLEQAATLDEKCSFAHIFLACDEPETVEMFRQRFGGRLLTIPAHRTPAHAPVSPDYEWLFEAERPQHRYLLGREILLEVLLLAKCGHLVSGLSNVSFAAMYFAEETQCAHPVPPLWVQPAWNQPSQGRTCLQNFPRAEFPPTVEVLESQNDELKRLLEAVENSRAGAAGEVAALQNQLATKEQLHAQALGEVEKLRLQAVSEVEALRHQLAVMEAEKTAALEAVSVAEKKAQRAESSLERMEKHAKKLEKRIRTLVNRWTWLGWRLMPWTKPPWARNPIDG